LLQIYLRLWECKIYQNRLRSARVIDKSLLPRFLCPKVYIHVRLYVDLGTVQIATTELQLMTKYINRNEIAINLWSVGNPDGLRQVQILIPQVQL